MEEILRILERKRNFEFISEEDILRVLKRSANSYEEAYLFRLQKFKEEQRPYSELYDAIIKLGIEKEIPLYTSIEKLDDQKYMGLALSMLIQQFEDDDFTLELKHNKSKKFYTQARQPMEITVFEDEHQPTIIYRIHGSKNSWARPSKNRFEYSPSLQCLGMKESVYYMDNMEICKNILGEEDVKRQDEARSGTKVRYVYEYRWNDLKPEGIIDKVLEYKSQKEKDDL